MTFTIKKKKKKNTITFYNVNGSKTGATFTTSSKIENLALSSESSRVAAALSDGTVWLWDVSGNAELIDRFTDSEGSATRLEFSPTGIRLAYLSANGIKLRDGISGRFIADLRCGPCHQFEFSSDGSHIASVSDAGGLRLWNSKSGGLIATVRNVGQDGLAISANGSLLATGNLDKVTLWNENRNHLAQLKVLELNMPGSMVFSLDNILAVATFFDIKFYNVKTQSFIHALSFGKQRPTALAFSPDCTCLAVGSKDGSVNLWDIRGINASGPPSEGNATVVSALTLSRDCSRLACGFGDGTVELWGTSPTKRKIGPLALCSKMEAVFFRIFRQSRHTKSVQALEFSPDGRLFASGSDDWTIKLWNGGDGALRGTLKAPGRLRAVALSNTVLVAAWNDGVALWSLDTLSHVQTFERSDDELLKVSIAEDNTLIAIACDRRVALLDVVNRTTIAKFYVPYDIHTMTFLPDNSQLVVQSDLGVFLSLNLVNKRITKGPTLEHLVQLPNTPLWNGVPIWHRRDKDSEQHYLSALFSQHKSPGPVLWVPRDLRVMAWTQGLSMIALGCKDGRVVLLRLRTSHIS